MCWWSRKKAENGECAWTTRISTRHARKTLSLYHKETKSLMRKPGMGCCHFWTPSRGIIKYPCIRQTRRKQPSSPPYGLFCYNVMLFGLKNTRATYQTLVTKMFRPLLGRTIEVYIDDMLVKSKERSDHDKHLQETFELLRAYEMKFNPSKCAFGVSVGRFLGFMVT